MTSEELKIRGELEKDIERELEEEIKDGICCLALRLHRLYQQQKERNARELSKYGFKQERKKNLLLSEVNINIKMEGETRIEIKEIKKQAPEKRLKSNPKTEIKQAVVAPKDKKFDWVKSLRSRSGPNSLSVDSKIDGSRQCKIHSNQAETGKTASQQHMVNKGDQSMLLELGWKD